MNAPESQGGPWLETPGALDQWLSTQPSDTTIGIDSEFERTTTFRAIPGLIQLASADEAFLVEPSTVEQSASFKSWLGDPGRPKLLYALSEDADLFREWLGVELRGALDLQIAAALAGEGMSVGYARLVERLLGAALDKEQTRSDWLQRPLSAAQIQYALADVIHLHALYDLLMQRLGRRDLTEAAWWETDRFLDGQQVNTEPETYYLRLRGGWFLPAVKQAALQRLVAWREHECRERNRPRGRVLNDKVLIALADRMPASRSALASVEGIPPVVVRRYSDQLLALIDEASKSGEGPSEIIEPPLTRGEQDVYRSLKKLIKPLVDEADVPMELLAPRRKLEAVTRDALRQKTAPEWLEAGWRGDILAPVMHRIWTTLGLSET